MNFQFVDYGPSDIRVAFVQNGNSWSLIGRQALFAKSNEPTMNLGWLTDWTPDYEFKRTILHEFGHALHQLFSKCKYLSLSGTNVFFNYKYVINFLMQPLCN